MQIFYAQNTPRGEGGTLPPDKAEKEDRAKQLGNGGKEQNKKAKTPKMTARRIPSTTVNHIKVRAGAAFVLSLTLPMATHPQIVGQSPLRKEGKAKGLGTAQS